MTYADFLASELLLEPAAAKLLAAAGFTVASPFVRVVDFRNGEPVLEELPDDCVFLQFRLQSIDNSVQCFGLNERGEERSLPCGATGVLEITRRVPSAPASAPPAGIPAGPWPGCYPRLLSDLGRIRALFALENDPFREILPALDILSIEFDAETERASERLAHQATVALRLRFAPAQGALT